MPRTYSLDAAKDLSALYGLPPFPLPDYRPAQAGPWRLAVTRGGLAHGYVTRAVVEPTRAVLYQGRTPWMSTGLLEQESHAWHVHQAHGLVVVAGLGMGMYAFAAAAKPEVERVVVADVSADVIAVMRDATAFETWPDRAKVTLLHANALADDFPARLKAETGGRRPDYLYADIWPDYPNARAPAQTAALVRALDPVAAGWWGQEIAWALHAHTTGETDPAAWFDGLGVPVPVTDGYRAFCRDAAAIHDIAALAGEKRGLLARLKSVFGGGG